MPLHKVRETAVGNEEREYFTVTPKKLLSLDTKFNGDYVTAINHGLFYNIAVLTRLNIPETTLEYPEFFTT